MFKTIVNAFKVKEIRNKILITFGLLLIYRLGCWLPVPGINVAAFKESIGGQDFLSLLSSVSGGALANGAILALGISPYISASIIIQLLTIAIPSLERLSKMGEEGKKKISMYNKVCALILAIVQAVAIVVSYKSALNTLTFPAWMVGTMVVLILVAGSMFTYWLGDKITALGIGNGLSLLIFVGILSTAASSLYSVIVNIFNGSTESIWELVLFLVALIFIFAFIVFIDLGERRIPVQYAKQIKGRKMYGGQNTNIPIRVNATGVMPIIFASSIISFPQLLCSIFWPNSKFYAWYSRWLGTGSWIYILLTGALITFFSYFWAQITFNPEEVSRSIQQNGGFILGIRPGKPTSDYLKKISNRITLFGAIFLAIIAIVPSMIFVSVAVELDKALDSQLLMRNYRGFLNK